MLKKNCFLLVLFFLSFILLNTSCANRRVARIEIENIVDLSGRFNDTDSSLIAEKLIKQMLNSNWHSDFNRENNRIPLIIVGHIKNKTMEHINMETFSKDLERAIVNSQSIGIVASSAEREEIRNERDNMQKCASIKSRKRLKNEKAADFMLKGIMTSIIDEYKGKKIVYYQTDLSLINTEKNTIVWAGQKKIKKFIKKARYSF